MGRPPTDAATWLRRSRRLLAPQAVRASRWALATLLLAFAALPAVAPGAAFAADATALVPATTFAATQPGGVYVVDYPGGFSSATPGRLKNAGVGVAIRYVGAAKWKSLTRSEANALRKSGIDIAAVYETNAKWMLGGRKAGVSAAKTARAAIVACGGPSNAFVYFACDTPTHDYATVNACLAGAASVMGASRVGVYGSYYVCDSALKSGYATKAWQTLAWSDGKVLPKAVLYQGKGQVYGSIALDYDPDFVRADDIGQWGYAGPNALAWNSATLPSPVSLNALDFVGKSQGWVVGDNGTVLHTADGGGSWLAQSAPTTQGLTALDFADASQGWAVGYGATALHTTDSGSTWTTQSVPTSAALTAVSFADAENGWAVGAGGTVLHTASAGATWTAQVSPRSARLRGVDFPSATTGWAVGDDGIVLRTTSAGVTWAVQSAPATATLRAVDFADARTGWAVGDAGTVLHTVNGSTWTTQSVPTTATLDAVHFIDAVDGWVVGENGTVLRTVDGGRTWRASPQSTTARLTGVRFADGVTGWAVGEGGTILRATGTGATPFGAVTGTVTDAGNGAPLGGITVWVDGMPTSPTSPDGTFVAARLKPGSAHTVAFTNALFIGQSRGSVTVAPGMRTTVNAQLTPRTATRLAPPSSTAAPVHTQVATLSVSITPTAAAGSAATTLQGWHYEVKTVVRTVKGKKAKVKVWHYRLRFTLKMTADQATGALTARVLMAGGSWRLQARFPGTWKYLPSTSAMASLKVF